MAPVNGTKRARSRADTEEFADDSGYAEASSNLRQRNSAHKRPRLSKVGDLDDDVSVQSSTLDESSEDDASMAEGVDEDGVAENDASEAGIDNDSDDYDPDIDDEEATRRYAESMRKRGTLQNHPALTAIIEEVTCTNFMCHAHLSMSMGPLINFIIGHNGSGKSAILTALQICLGGRATTTNRGQSLKSFIKQGTDRTSLLVRIKNQGELAYLPDLYGPSIIVERHFSMSGTSGFSIRNASGKQVSSKKSDLDDILDALSLQLDNPMNVLTQDMARQFLNSSSPADKYKFFIKGTHLEQLDTDYKVLSDSLDKNNTELYKLKEVRDKARMTVVEATKKVARAEEQRTMQDRASFVRRQVIWSQVRDREEKLSAIDQEIRETEEDIQTREQKVDQSAAKYERAEKARDEATKVIQQLKDLLTPKQRDKAQVLDFFQDNKKELLRLHTEMRDINGELKAAKKKVQNLNTHIEAENEKLANAEDGRHGEKLAEIQTAKDEITQLKERQQTHAADLDQLQRAILGAQDGAKRAYPLVSEKSAQVKACESTIASLSNPRESWQAAFPRSLPSLLRAINNEARFKELPVGPLGRSVSLLEPKWSSILEKSFGSALEGFAVTSKHDQLLLTEIMRKTGYPVRVFLGRADPIDTSGNEPSAEMTTWLRVLKIDNDLARNTFIINQRIDQTVLVTTQDEAGSMMMQGRIPYVGQIFAPRRDGGGFRYAFTNGGNQTQSPIDRWGGKPRMQTDAESRIAMERQNLANLKQDLTQAERALREAQDHVKRAQQALNLHKKEAQAFVIQIQRQEEKVTQLRDQLEEATPQTGVLDSYREDLKKAQEEETVFASQYQDMVNERDRLNGAQRELKDQLDKVDSEVELAESEIKKAENHEQKLEQKRYNILLEKNVAVQAVEDAQTRLLQHQNSREEAQQELEGVIAQASAVCERVPLDRGRTTEDYESSFTRLQQDLQKSQKINGGTREQLLEAQIAAQADFAEKDRLYQDIKHTLETLTHSLTYRRKRWDKFRKYMSINAKLAFTYLLSERMFRGTLTIKNETKTLDMTIEPDITRKSNDGRQTATLSGGEKSFATICLLLSIWEAMGSPIRCLDEFDVFMDQVNRDISMQMLIKAARSSTSRQFIFITPQAMNNIQLGEDVKIHKMRDPERGQTTLPFGRA